MRRRCKLPSHVVGSSRDNLFLERFHRQGVVRVQASPRRGSDSANSQATPIGVGSSQCLLQYCPASSQTPLLVFSCSKRTQEDAIAESARALSGSGHQLWAPVTKWLPRCLWPNAKWLLWQGAAECKMAAVGEWQSPHLKEWGGGSRNTKWMQVCPPTPVNRKGSYISHNCTNS